MCTTGSRAPAALAVGHWRRHEHALVVKSASHVCALGSFLATPTVRRGRCGSGARAAHTKAMVQRKGGLSGKQKSALLKQQRANRATAGEDGKRGGASSGGGGDDGVKGTGKPRMIQQVSRTGARNALSTAFLREDDAVVAARRLDGSRPFAACTPAPPIAQAPDGSLGLPVRPAWTSRAGDAGAQEEAELAHFEQWLAGVHARFGAHEISPFEHNIEVRRRHDIEITSDHVLIPSDTGAPR